MSIFNFSKEINFCLPEIHSFPEAVVVTIKSAAPGLAAVLITVTAEMNDQTADHKTQPTPSTLGKALVYKIIHQVRILSGAIPAVYFRIRECPNFKHSATVPPF